MNHIIFFCNLDMFIDIRHLIIMFAPLSEKPIRSLTFFKACYLSPVIRHRYLTSREERKFKPYVRHVDEYKHQRLLSFKSHISHKQTQHKKSDKEHDGCVKP